MAQEVVVRGSSSGEGPPLQALVNRVLGVSLDEWHTLSSAVEIGEDRRMHMGGWVTQEGEGMEIGDSGLLRVVSRWPRGVGCLQLRQPPLSRYGGSTVPYESRSSLARARGQHEQQLHAILFVTGAR